MSDAIEELFQAVREACTSQVWSRGVELVRGEAVAGERDDGDEVILRVSAPGSAVSPTVVLLPDDEEWECNCKSREDVCDHVAAELEGELLTRDPLEDAPHFVLATSVLEHFDEAPAELALEPHRAGLLARDAIRDPALPPQSFSAKSTCI